ncbi:MAG: glycoside hydrolase family 99-like domain-containing protein [Desulfovibrionaceae bacterium]|nr:glycoside hydrolase family 99-like domain-containing protein [Desulfovibrionaceae bacterium]
MQCVAFYLPQFHPIPENDAIYGKGFTEWDIVRQSKPLFPGHYQPHIPHKMVGWYNLLNEKFLAYQHDLAFSNGLTAFCYYYYNFAGHTLLEKPLQSVLRNRTIKNRFCLCWVHTDWYDNRIGPSATFIRQTYSRANARALFHALSPYFEDQRYITIDGRPLLLIWAAERHPMMQLYAETLREESQKHGFSDMCLAGVEAYAGMLPAHVGLDCMVEFAPNWRRENHVSQEGELPVRIDYGKTVSFMLHKEIPPYARMRCAFPGWDNTARRGIHGIACTGANPRLFKSMLDFLRSYTEKILPPAMQYIFVNAWNEWGEGCHIEPDERFGDSYLRLFRPFQTM